MAGPLREKIRKWVSRFIPDYSHSDLLIIALHSGHDVVQNAILGYLVLLVQNQWTVGDLRTSGVIANVQKGIEAFLRVFLIYMAKSRIGLIRMTLYSYPNSIIGLQLLWVNKSQALWYYCLALLPLTMGQAGGGCISHLLELQHESEPHKGEEAEAKKGKGETKKKAETKKGTAERKPAEAEREEEKKPAESHHTLKHLRDVKLHNAGSPAAITRAEQTMAQAGENCVCFFLGEQYNWRPHVCPMQGEQAREGIGGCCYTPPSRGSPSSSSSLSRTSSWSLPSRSPMTRYEKSLAKFPGTIAGAVFVSTFSFKQRSFKISTAWMVVVYHLFFWMSTELYKYEKDIGKKDEKDIGKKYENQSQDKSVSVFPFGQTLASQLKEAGKILLKLFPLWLPFVFSSYLVAATGDSFFMSQVDYLETHTQQTKLPIILFYLGTQFVSFSTSQVCSYLIELFYCNDKNKQQGARLFSISIGMVFSFLCCIVACLVARILDCNSNVSMFWLLPQYLLLGMMQGIIDEGVNEFLSDHMEKEFHAAAVVGCAEGLGFFVSAILTLAAPSSWIGSDIGKSNLYNYYRMLAIISLCSTILFIIVAIAYKLSLSAKKEQTVLRRGRRAEA